eukprot:scaffold12932_cov106-Phaeocystis_antarctica.AAC.1
MPHGRLVTGSVHWCRVGVRVPGEDVPGATSREKRRVGAGRPPRPNIASHTPHTHVYVHSLAPR